MSVSVSTTAAASPSPTSKRTIALIAHDNKKEAMISFAKEHVMKLRDDFFLIATGTTGSRVEEATGLSVEKFLSGPLGGDAQIASKVAEKKVAAVFFFVDPLSAHPHDPDINGLLRICNVHNVPFATNVASAELLIRAL
jgi:methylglyoxal synthase